MRSLKTSLLATVAMLSVGNVAHAQLTTLYGGGATFPSKTLRLLFDCYAAQANGGNNGTTDVAAVMQPYDAACNGGAGFGLDGLYPGPQIAMYLYAPVGSGGGKGAFANHTMVAAPANSNAIAFTDGRDPSFGFAIGGFSGYNNPPPGTPGGHIDFAGSDDIVTPNDIATYKAGAPSNFTKYGQWIGIPDLLGPVTIDFNGKDGAGAALPLPTDSRGKPILNLSRKSFCGIFSGHITKWSNASLVADNPGLAGVPAGAAQQITVVHRSDKSGTTFLFTNALVEQCSSKTGGHVPYGKDDTTGLMTDFTFPWADQYNDAPDGFALVGSPKYSCSTPAPVAGAPANALPIEGGNLIGWPDFVGFGGAAGVDICGTTIPVPVGYTAVFTSASGSGGVTSKVTTTNGSIGYVSPDFVAPIVLPAGNPVANLQNEHDLNLGLPGFIAPSFGAATIALSAAVPPSPTNPDGSANTDFPNPLTWSLAEQVPNPAVAGAYPISGFTNFAFYQCYSNGNKLSLVFNYLKYHYGVTNAPVAANIMNGQGFAPVPGTTASGWLGAIVNLVTPATTVSAPIQSGPAAGICTIGDE